MSLIQEYKILKCRKFNLIILTDIQRVFQEKVETRNEGRKLRNNNELLPLSTNTLWTL